MEEFDKSSLYYVDSTPEGTRYSLYDTASWKNGLAFKNIDFSETGLPVIKIAELNNGISSSTAYTDKTYSLDVFLTKGDYVFSWSGNPETSIDIYKYNLSDGWLNQHIFKVTPKTEIIDKGFFFYLMKFLKPYFKKIATNKQTTGLGHVTISDLQRMSVTLPPLPTQQKIAAILSSLDDKIELNNKINTNLEQQAQAIYTNICKNAETQKLENLISSIETGTRPKGGAEHSGIPSIGAEKIEGLGKYDYSNEKYISRDFFSKMKRGIVLSKDVLLYKDGAYTGKSSMALNGFPHKECAVNEHVFILRTKDNYAQFFLYCTLKNPDIHKSIYNLACGKAAQPGLNQQELLTVNIPFPSKEIIKKFEETVSPLMNNIAENALENRNLATIRDTLLPKLMNGEIETDSIIIDKR